MDVPSVSPSDQFQDFFISAVLFLIFAVALTLLCSALLWCHFHVLFKKDKVKKAQLNSMEYSA
ncbi:hypothetical protein OESDEN_11598 [Oesophagostomum dentatum]|uniref:Uncharacterized protein n=1 Tax=Oesophagostomum dentatum TaxID=61180 RepID=A0A0B1SXH7_OESDE|nr:hypothetical protein OESDEN_24585 [Oesophagostomum dentatum]KHJ88606.1 hypothetical protein OESDEN_11598 [Oesophagostomum dentatum]